VGKSTFLKVLTGSLELAAGNVRLGETARIGYYEQVGLMSCCRVGLRIARAVYHKWDDVGKDSIG
jgi:ATPase subunit of ABC transporter with duplicated ATPase domains